MKIEIGKKYHTESCLEVSVIKDDLRGTPWPVVIVIDCGDGSDTIDFCSVDGMTTSHGQLVEYGSQFKMDDPVMVRDADSHQWEKRYFAYLRNDGPFPTFATWRFGLTSWTAGKDAITIWDCCRKPTVEELVTQQPLQVK